MSLKKLESFWWAWLLLGAALCYLALHYQLIYSLLAPSLDMVTNAVNKSSNAMTAIATVIMAVLTWVLAQENRRLRRAGTEPEVVAYLAPHPDGNGAINFVLTNIGQGPARNVKFSFECDEEDFASHNVFLRNNPQRTQIGLLPQGEKLPSLFGGAFELVGGGGGIPLKPFLIKISYDDLSGKPRETVQNLDIAQFTGLYGLLAKPANREIADSLKKIESHLAALARQRSASSNLVDATTTHNDVRQFRAVKTVASGGNENTLDEEAH